MAPLSAKIVIGVPKELKSGESRVALSPEGVAKLIHMGFEVQVESGAGAEASFPDLAYSTAGARIVSQTVALWKQSDLILKIHPPLETLPEGQQEIEFLKEGGFLICFVWPGQNADLLKKLEKKKATALSLDCIPRISRAQKMDVLSSMANIAGYRAVIEAAHQFGRFFTGQITAAGKVPPARVLVIGAGVAGLAAIGTARGLGAIVKAFDTRPEVKDQVKSMGAEFLDLHFKETEDGSGEGGYAKVMSPAFIQAEMELFAQQAKEVDIIITTALIPGKPAPLLLKKETVALMKQGSVIVDMATEQGGNCELSQPDQVVQKNGVSIIGYTNLPSRLANTASQLFSSNLVHLLTDICKGTASNFQIDQEDEVIRASLITDHGELTWPPPKKSAEKTSLARPVSSRSEGQSTVGNPTTIAKTKEDRGKKKRISGIDLTLMAMALIFFFLGRHSPSEFLNHFSIFVLAIIVGWQVVWNVTPALHTPLMSVTNAVSGIIIIGALVQLEGGYLGWSEGLALVAIVISSINIAGGFLVTQRMLKMFQK